MSDTVKPAPVSPTTGEPVDVVASRNRLGIYLLIVIDFMGTVALIISYAYLWALNVNNGWAPPGSQFTAFMSNGPAPSATGTSFAADWPFWVITFAVIVTCALTWWSYRLIRRGDQTVATAVSAAAIVVAIATLVAQWWQISTLPFSAANGTYASAVLILLSGNIVHLLIVIFLLLGITNRVRMGLISRSNPWQSQFVSIWITWIAVAFILGAFVTSTMKVSPNDNPTRFGGFEPRTSQPSPAASPSPSGSPSPSATPSASPSPSP